MKEKLIRLILQNGIIGTNFKEPITFKSGIRSPIYCNFRKTSAFPDDLLDLTITLLKDEIKLLDVDCIAGVATSAIPYSSICGRELVLPTCYVRPDAKAKDYGLKKLIEGCNVSGKKVALLEDLVSTSGSIVENAKILKQYGAESISLISIFSYEMERSKKELAESGFVLNPILTISDFLPELKKQLSEKDYDSLIDWIRDPEGWFDRHKLEFNFGFLTQLRQSAKDSGSIICMGHDPVLASLPLEFQKLGIFGYYEFMKQVLSELKIQKVFPGMFKPNLPWWLSHDQPHKRNFSGSIALSSLMLSMKSNFPNVQIDIDSKSGDISTSSTKWAQYILDQWSADAMTVHTYMGSDSVGPFLDYCNDTKSKGIYLLVKTTNKGAADLELKKMSDGRFVYEHVADNVIGWAKGKPGVGVVAAGNSPEGLMVIGKALAQKDIALLIPGVGPSQGGDAGEVAGILRESGCELGITRINLSSGLTQPWYQPGKENPPTNECISMIVDTLRSLNEKVAYV